MALKLINASDAKSGTNILVDGVPCTVRNNDISKPGKHGHAKCRIEAISMVDGKKKVIAMGGHERLEVPMIDKRTAQILSKEGDKISVMDMESYESFELPAPDFEVNDGEQIEYWDVEGQKIIKRKL